MAAVQRSSTGFLKSRWRRAASWCGVLALGVGVVRAQEESGAVAPDVARRPIRIWSLGEFGGGPVMFNILRHPRTGFIYVGNGRGVLEYDGVRWGVIDPPDRVPTRGVIADHAGNLWVGRYNGLLRLQPDPTGELRPTAVSGVLPAGLTELGYVRAASDSPGGMIFVGRDEVVRVPASGPAQVWRAEAPLLSAWWMDGAVHATVTKRGLFRLEADGTSRLVNPELFIVFASRPIDATHTLLLASRGPVVWNRETSDWQPLGETARIFPAVHAATAAAFLADGRMAFTIEGGRLVILAPDGALRLDWPSIPTMEYNHCQGIVEDFEGGLWLAKHAGIIRIQLDPPGSVRPAPPLAAIIRRVEGASGDPLFSASAGRPPGTITLPQDERTARVEFTAVSFRQEKAEPEPLQFRSRLEGADADWTAWSAVGSRLFTELPTGVRRLAVQVRRAGGEVGAETTLTLAVSRSWARSPWSWVIYAACGAGLFAVALQQRTRVLRRRNLELEALVADRTRELAAKNAELASHNAELARLHELDLGENTAARLAAEKARLEVLRYQLNPHFLHNTLNTIYSLVLTAPERAAETVHRLADFCRLALVRHEEAENTVGAELDKIGIYLDIEKARWGDTLRVEITADAAARVRRIPPFLLLPLVENAVKYGGATSESELRVTIHAHVAPDGALVIDVANTGRWVEPGSEPVERSTGIGLGNLRQRLQRSFPGTHELTFAPADGWVRVRLALAPARVNTGAPFAPPSP